jgi:hypothetical protein
VKVELIPSRLNQNFFPIFYLDPILRLLNLQLQRQSCRRLERFIKGDENIFDFNTRGVLNFYSAGGVIPDRRIGLWSQSYDYWIYSNNASAEVHKLERFYIKENKFVF